MKSLIAVAFAFAFFAPFSHVQAMGYGGGCDGFFFACGTGYGAPREELVVYAWGPGTTAQSPYNNYQQPSYQNYYQQPYQPVYQPNYYQAPQYSYYQPQYQYSYQPQYYQPQYSYGYPQYDYYTPQYSYGYDYGYGGYGPTPMGTQDLFGNQLCDWGTGYRGYRCDYDPHQWILDPYTGQYY